MESFKKPMREYYLTEGFPTVRCTRCGTENSEDARYCVECGALLHPSRATEEKHEYEERDICFGRGQTVRFVWLFIGLIIVLWGLSVLIEVYLKIPFEWWPLIMIAIGLYIVYRVLSRPKRS